MSLDYICLQSLLQAEPEAMEFYDALSENARGEISKRASHVNSFEDLKAMARNLVGENT